MTIHLGGALPHLSSDIPEDFAPTQMPSASTRRIFLFCLAPGGVCPAIFVAKNAVRSYRTISPLPMALKTQRAVYFLWHFP